MEKFYRVGDVLVDVEQSLIIDTSEAKQMQIDLAQFCVKDFNKRISCTPIRIDNDGGKTVVLSWDKARNKWINFRVSHGENIGIAIEKFVNLHIEGDLLT
jgi:hypothetical protein